MSLHIRITPSNEPDELPANFTRGARNAAWPFRLRNLVRRYLRRSAQHGPWLLVGLALSVILNLYLLGHGTASLDLVAPSERPGSGIPHPGNHHPSHPPGHHGPEHDENAALISLAPTLPADWSRSALAAQYRGLTELIVVTGNAVFWGNPYDMAHVAHGESWALEPFQTESDVAGFLEHIRMGSDMLAQRPESLLVFSGGQTKPQAGMRSEAQSYWQLAQGQGWFKSDNLWRATTEEFARDSFENILFSMCRFYELTGHYPRKLSVISYPFKQKRYETLHRVALKIPETMFEFIGLPVEDPIDPRKAEGELKNAFSLFQSDPYGCDGTLAAKRLRRDPFLRKNAYHDTCPHLRDLLDYCLHSDHHLPFPKQLPWEKPTKSAAHP